MRGVASSPLPPLVLSTTSPGKEGDPRSVAPPSLPPPVPVPVALRRSARHAVAADGSSATDEDALAKAMRRKAEQFTDVAGTSCRSKSFLAFSDSNISAKLIK